VIQLSLVSGKPAPSIEGIDLRCCDTAEMMASVEGASLVVADPPWTYANAGTRGAAGNHYGGLPIPVIASHVKASSLSAAPSAYLLLWCTWPLLGEWILGSAALMPGWRLVTGGSWHKDGRLGVGFHVRGDSEPLLIYVKGKPRPLEAMSNAHGSPRTAHSEKPLGWARDHVRAFCPSGGLVLDVYAGMAPYARACMLEGRRYVGAELDPDRHALAMGLLHRAR
jgi:hypothetical protein